MKNENELKKIFDELRAIGSPREYSLNEVLEKAIRIEKESLMRLTNTFERKSFFDEPKNDFLQTLRIWSGKLSQLPIHVTVVSALFLGIASLVYVVRTSDEMTYRIGTNSQLLRVENRN